MGKIAIYARVSTLVNQDYQRQVDELTTIILQHGYSIEDIDIYAEHGSGYKKNAERPEIQRMLNVIENDNKYYDCIYVSEISRIGRNPSEVRKTIDDLTDKRIPVFIKSLNSRTFNQDGKRDAIMQITIQILIEFADAEAEQLKTRSRSGLLKSAKEGNIGGGKYLLYGYKKGENKKMIIDDEEAEVIKEVFQLYKEGNGTKVIAGILNSRGIPTRTKKSFSGQIIKFNIAKSTDDIVWSDKQVHDIIRNTTYKGDRKYKIKDAVTENVDKKEIIISPAEYTIIKSPIIIEPDLFDECTEIRVGKSHRNYLTTYTYLLKDLIVCGCCGRNYSAKFKPTPHGDKVYKCSSTLIKGGSCRNVGINISLIESAIYDQLLQSDSILKYLSQAQNLKKEIEADIKKLEHQFKRDNDTLLEKEGEKERSYLAYIKKGISEQRFLDTAKTIDSEIETLNKRIKICNKQLTEKRIILSKQNDNKATKQMLIDASENRIELRTIFKQFINKIIINNLNNDWLLATLFIQVNAIIFKVPLKMVLDKQGVRKKPVQLNYISFFKMVSDPVFKDNILLVEKNHIIAEIQSELNDKDWITVPSQNTLTIPINEIAKKELYLENII